MIFRLLKLSRSRLMTTICTRWRTHRGRESYCRILLWHPNLNARNMNRYWLNVPPLVPKQIKRSNHLSSFSLSSSVSLGVSMIAPDKRIDSLYTPDTNEFDHMNRTWSLVDQLRLVLKHGMTDRVTVARLFEHHGQHLRCWLGNYGRFMFYFNKFEAKCDILLTASGAVTRSTKDVETETPIWWSDIDVRALQRFSTSIVEPVLPGTQVDRYNTVLSRRN